MSKQSDIWSESLCYVAQSDIGMRRSNNQDAFVVVLSAGAEEWYERGHTFTVADGMGAHAAGELASKLAVDTLPHTYRKLLQLSPPDALRAAIQEANSLIHARGQSSADFHGMGTTCSSLVLLPQGALIGHVGDSRVYRLRNHLLEQLTFDHSLVWEMEVARKASRSAVQLNVPKNVITRSLGPHPKVQIDLEGPFPIAVGDKYLLCSDGLSGPIEDDEIAALLDCLPIDEALQTMVDLANLRGGPDNITAIVLEITGSQLATGSSVAVRTTGKTAGVHPAVWAAVGAGLVIAMLLLVIGNVPAAVISALVALAVGGIGLFSKLAGSTPSTGEMLDGLLGDGPYRRYNAAASLAFVAKLAELTESLDATAREQLADHVVASISDEAERAATSLSAGDMDAALSQYARTIRRMMQAFRDARE